jgi:hypothetical protein
MFRSSERGRHVCGVLAFCLCWAGGLQGVLTAGVACSSDFRVFGRFARENRPAHKTISARMSRWGKLRFFFIIF